MKINANIDEFQSKIAERIATNSSKTTQKMLTKILLLIIWVWSGAEVCKPWRSRKDVMLKKESLVGKIDTAEKEPPEVCWCIHAPPTRGHQFRSGNVELVRSVAAPPARDALRVADGVLGVLPPRVQERARVAHCCTRAIWKVVFALGKVDD